VSGTTVSYAISVITRIYYRGFGPSKTSAISGASVSGPNAIAVSSAESVKGKAETELEKEERRRVRKAEKKARKEERRARKGSKNIERYISDESEDPRLARDRERSRSPSRKHRSGEDELYRSRRRSRTPLFRSSEYKGREGEKEREQHRWDDSRRSRMPQR
jgi:hypothetical protein